MSESRHTPLPWAVDGLDEFAVTADCDGLMVFETEFEDRSEEENAANAAFIVQAVNSHHELLEALEGFNNFAWTAVEADCEESRTYLNQLVANARAAIAKARGQQ